MSDIAHLMANELREFGRDREPSRLRRRLLSTQQIRQLPPPSYLIDGLLVTDSVAALFGKPGSNKSFLALDWALCVASGTPWHGRKVKQGKVLFIVGEGVNGIGKRIQAWESARGVSVADQVGWLSVAPNLLDPMEVNELIDVAEEVAPVFVVLDTLSRCMPGGDENSSKDMSMTVDALDRLRQVTGATVQAIHHTPKDGGSLRGHSSLEGSVQTSIRCSAQGNIVTLTVDKQKDDEAEVVTLVRRKVGDSCVLDSHENGRSVYCKSEAAVRVVRALGESQEPNGLTTAELIKAAKVAEPTFHKVKKRLVEAGEITSIGTPNKPRWVLAERADQ